jgi:hypothetical protein
VSPPPSLPSPCLLSAPLPCLQDLDWRFAAAQEEFTKNAEAEAISDAAEVAAEKAEDAKNA